MKYSYEKSVRNKKILCPVKTIFMLIKKIVLVSHHHYYFQPFDIISDLIIIEYGNTYKII